MCFSQWLLTRDKSFCSEPMAITDCYSMLEHGSRSCPNRKPPQWWKRG